MGWYNVTSLQSALALVEEVPPDLPFDEFCRELVKDHLDLAQKWETWREEVEAMEEQYYNERHVRGKQVFVGDLVLLQKGSGERSSGGKLLPRADGPYEVDVKPSDHTAKLKTPRGGTPVLEGRPQPMARIIPFAFPKALMQPAGSELQDKEMTETTMVMTEAQILLLQANDVVCYAAEDSEGPGAGLIIVDAVHSEQQRVSGRKLKAQGPGPWKDRVWQVEVVAETAEKAHLPFADLLCQVELEGAKLTQGSHEAMRKSGVVL